MVGLSPPTTAHSSRAPPPRPASSSRSSPCTNESAARYSRVKIRAVESSLAVTSHSPACATAMLWMAWGHRSTFQTSESEFTGAMTMTILPGPSGRRPSRSKDGRESLRVTLMGQKAGHCLRAWQSPRIPIDFQCPYQPLPGPAPFHRRFLPLTNQTHDRAGAHARGRGESRVRRGPRREAGRAGGSHT